jgi:hypothetical protein
MRTHTAIEPGTRFNRLTVKDGPTVEPSPYASKKHVYYYRCRCDCGSEVRLRHDLFATGKTRSCGCLTGHFAKGNKPANRTHGMGNDPLYKCWHAMHRRCTDPKQNGFHNYGGRGIRVECPDWSRFEPFRDWALSHGYRPDLQIDRVDVNGNYRPENCRFVTPKENMNNRRCTRPRP